MFMANRESSQGTELQCLKQLQQNVCVQAHFTATSFGTYENLYFCLMQTRSDNLRKSLIFKNLIILIKIAFSYLGVQSLLP